MILSKIIAIVAYYKGQIKDLIKDIKSYYLAMILGSISIVIAVLIILHILLESKIGNFATIASSVISVIGAFVLNLYFSNVDKIKSCNKKKKKNKTRIVNYFIQRHSTAASVLENVEKEFIKITFDPPIE